MKTSSHDSSVYLEVDVVARQFTEEFFGQPVDNRLPGLSSTSTVLGLNAQYSVEHVTSQVALISAETQRNSCTVSAAIKSKAVKGLLRCWSQISILTMEQPLTTLDLMPAETRQLF